MTHANARADIRKELLKGLEFLAVRVDGIEQRLDALKKEFILHTKEVIE